MQFLVGRREDGTTDNMTANKAGSCVEAIKKKKKRLTLRLVIVYQHCHLIDFFHTIHCNMKSQRKCTWELH